VRYVFSPPADQAAGLLTLPCALPLAQWRDERLVSGLLDDLPLLFSTPGGGQPTERLLDALVDLEAGGLLPAVGTTTAAHSYFATVLPHVPQPLTTVAEDATG
jgi:hypothetical protein